MPVSIRVAEFDLWRPGYGGTAVEVLVAGTTTLAQLFAEPTLETPLPNPQTLNSRTEAGVTYGRFAVPVYTNSPYVLLVNTGERTGVERIPLYSLSGADASSATVRPGRSNVSRTLAAHLDAEVRVDNFGALGASPTANKAILDAAIGAAAAQGGGRVLLPFGNWEFTQISLPQDVVLVGHGRGATILRSQQTTAVVTIAGDGAGLMGLTLDGLNLNAGSIGVLGIGRNRIILENIIIKRFAQGILLRGGDMPRFRELYVQNCTKGADLRGDRDALFTGTGGPLRGMSWEGGAVETCATEGLRLSFEDDPVLRSTVRGVQFGLNTGPAVILNGCRVTTFDGCSWEGNLANLQVTDDNDLSRADENTVQQVVVLNSSMSGGTLSFNGLCEDIRFEGCDFSDVDWVLSVPTLPILLLDCTEDSLSTATGALDRLMRNRSHKIGEFPGVTTDGNWTTAWQLEIDPGEVLRVRARVIGRRRDGTAWYSGGLQATFFRFGSTLSFAQATAGTPVIGTVVSGATSGAEARVIDVSGISSGTLTLRSISGDFINGEALAFSDGKSAAAASGLTPGNAVIQPEYWAKDAGEIKSVPAWDIRPSVSGFSAVLQVRGDSGMIVEWLVEADVMRP
jgi:hypothetical protein